MLEILPYSPSFIENDNVSGGVPNGLRYLRWGGDGEAVQPEK